MYEKALKYLRKRIKRMRMWRIVKPENNIYLFGACERTRYSIKYLREAELNPVAVIDNSKIKHNGYCGGLKVLYPEEIPLLDKNTRILLPSGSWREMKRQLISMEVPQKHIISIYSDSFIEKNFCWRLFRIWRGRLVYNRIRGNNPNSYILLAPYTGTGDAYLIGSFLDEYLERKHIKDYTLVVVSNACKKVLSLFNYKQIEQISTDDCSLLIQYYMLCPEKCSMEVLNDSWGEVYTNPLRWLRGYREGLDFTEMFRRFVFRLPITSRPKRPILAEKCAEVDEIFARFSLEEGNTVILSPYSNTLADLPSSFWENLVNRIKDEGFVVVTNGSGKDEPAIKGTIGIFFPLSVAINFINKAGFFIGVRSGFCDVVSSSSACKIILYDKNNYFFNSTAYKYFSLNKMKLCNDAIEIEYDNENILTAVDVIMENIEKSKGDVKYDR